MSLHVTNVCRICLASLSSRKFFNLYLSPGRTQQISTKIMACAWVQVFDGDGLPSYICGKCHDTLEIAYQFKQLCESSDAQLRQFFGRNLTNKNNCLDLAQESRECATDFKPINFNMCSERLELPQCDLSLNTLRLLNQDMPFMQNLQLNLPEQPCDTKEEPGYHSNVNFNSVLPDLRPDQCTAVFKSNSCVDGESLLCTIQAKLLEAVSESLSNAIPAELNDNRLVAWDLQNKQPLLPIPEKTISDLSAVSQKITEDVGKEDSLSFLDETRCMLSPEKSIMCNDLENDLKIESRLKENIVPQSKECNSVTLAIPGNEKAKTEHGTLKNLMKCKKGKVREQCELCGKVFRYSGYLQLHMRTHTDERPHVCCVCKQTFSMQHVLVMHMRMHSGDKPYICADCGKGFSQSSGLKTHMRMHSGERPYQCEICTMRFAQSSNLKTHKLTHSGRRDHVCKICNTAFKFLKHLRSHQKTHYDSKEFKCHLCPKAFIRKRALTAHISVHRGSKPYRCDTCGHACASATNLRTHMRVHSGVKPYTCQICKKNFTQSSTLKRHLKQHRVLATPQPHTTNS